MKIASRLTISKASLSVASLDEKIAMEVSRCCSATGGKNTRVSATGVSIDSRTIQPGDVFVALKADRDGHEFVNSAFEMVCSGTCESRSNGFRYIISTFGVHRDGRISWNGTLARTGLEVAALFVENFDKGS